MIPILVGTETEYGLLVEGRGASSQVEDSMALVRSYPGRGLAIWDYQNESPRSDLRGFRLDRLQFDPEDAKFDQGKSYGAPEDVRSDRVLPCGGRFYNDHGHPEFSTPECFDLNQLVAYDILGERVVLEAARKYAEAEGRAVSIYKNNTDFHGASYGSHESYLVPRSVGVEALCLAVMPMLVARQVVSGAGKVGSESGAACDFQMSQRADFFVEPVNAETLYRRPIFNTRDEPHASHADWIRLHVISGDANMIAGCTWLKVGLIRLAIHALLAGTAPKWNLADPVRAFKEVSRAPFGDPRIDLVGGNWTTAEAILDSYVSIAEDIDGDVATKTAELIAARRSDFDAFARRVDWAAKWKMLNGVVQEEGLSWRDARLQAYDLEYHNVDPDESLHRALVEMDEVEANPTIDLCLDSIPPTDSRALARGTAVRRFADRILTVGWRRIVFSMPGGERLELDLPPDARYPAHIIDAPDVETFVKMVQGVK